MRLYDKSAAHYSIWEHVDRHFCTANDSSTRKGTLFLLVMKFLGMTWMLTADVMSNLS